MYFVEGRAGWPLKSYITAHGNGHWLVRPGDYVLHRCTAAIVNGSIVFTNAAAGGLPLELASPPAECVPITGGGAPAWTTVIAAAEASWITNETIPDDVADVFSARDDGAHNSALLIGLSNPAAIVWNSDRSAWVTAWPLHAGVVLTTWAKVIATMRLYAAALRAILADANTEATWTAQGLIKKSRYDAGLRLLHTRGDGSLRLGSAGVSTLASWRPPGKVVMTSASHGEMQLVPAAQTLASALGTALARIDAEGLEWWEE